jgi:hypothetical protein
MFVALLIGWILPSTRKPRRKALGELIQASGSIITIGELKVPKRILGMGFHLDVLFCIDLRAEWS